jgi:AAA ATPase domain
MVSGLESSWANLFELQNLGGKDLKGSEGPVRAWVALRSATVESRFDALHASGLTELVGREEELELLLRRWSKAKTAEGQVVLLSGEPGIGKSRLTLHCSKGLPRSRTCACATSVLRSTPTVPFIRSSARWNVPQDLRTPTLRK